MKSTNLVLDLELLDQATTVLGVKTYSATINLALAEVLRLRKIQNLPQFFGRGLWQGSLEEMCEGALTLNVECEAANEVGRSKERAARWP